MKMARLGGLCLLILCGALSAIWGFSLHRNAHTAHLDFKPIYMATSCMLDHCDPYKESDLARIYQAEEHNPFADTLERQILTRFVYPPTIFSVMVPFALLPWPLAHQLWFMVTAASLFTAAILMWTRGVKYAPVLTTFLMCVLLANCEVVFGTENAGGIAVNLCVIAVWCFLQERFIAWGVVCLAMSLVIKPHDAGFVWLFFLLAGESYRKRAMQTLIVAVILSLPSIVWVSHVSPHWIQELHANLANFSARGDLNDPGPTAVSGRTGNMIISLQAVFSVLWDEPSFYNPATYLVCAPLFLLWARRVSRTRLSADGAWLAIAAVVPLTMLVTYHRTYDAKLIMLTVPACAMLFAKGDRIAQWAFAFTTAGIFFSADIPLGMVLAFSGKLHLKPAGFIEKALFILLYRPVPLLLLAMAAFYLWVFLRRTSKQSASMSAETGGTIPDLPAQA